MSDSTDNILNLPPDKLTEKAKLEDAEKLRKYQEENRRLFNEIVDRRMSGAEVKELERLAGGGVDWSLFNLMLERVDFTDCTNMIEAMRKMYIALWPYYSKTILENAFLRKLSSKVPPNSMATSEMERLLEILQSDVDPNGIARRTLEEIRELAKKRRELNLY